MTRIIAALVTMGLVLALTTAGTSQEKDKKAKGILPDGWKNLNLTLEQKGKIYAVQTDYKAKVLKLQEEIKSLKAQETADMAKVLTAEQKAALAKALGVDPKKDDKKEEPKNK